MDFQRVYSLFAVLLTLAPAGVAEGKDQHAVLRLGHLGRNAVVLGCLTDAELNAKTQSAQGEPSRYFGWQFKSKVFQCRQAVSELPNVTATCTPKEDEPSYMDFFFASVQACRAFETAITPACADAPAAGCLEFMETYFKPRRPLGHPI